MRRVDLAGEREVTAPGSIGARVRRLASGAHVVVIEVEPGGVVARHPAAGFQLLITPSGVEPMIASWVDSRIAANFARGAAVRLCFVALLMRRPAAARQGVC